MEDWDEEKTVLLIQFYQEREIIWNPKHINYKKSKLKIDSWNEIGEAMGTTGEICKKKMISVLSSYRREKAKEINSQGTGKGSTEIYKSKWFAYEALAFLNDRNQPRKRSNTIVQENSEERNVEEEALSTENRDEVPQVSSPSEPHPPTAKKARLVDQRLDVLKKSFGILQASSDNINAFIKQTNIENEEVKHYCGFLGTKMCKYSDITRSSVQHAINNIIFQADQGFYEPNYNGKHMGPSTSQGYPHYSTIPYSQQNVPYCNTAKSFQHQRNTFDRFSPGVQHSHTQHSSLSSTSSQFVNMSNALTTQPQESPTSQSLPTTSPNDLATPSPYGSPAEIAETQESVESHFNGMSDTQDSILSQFTDLV